MSTVDRSKVTKEKFRRSTQTIFKHTQKRNMNTIRYGTSVGPSGVNGEGAPHTWEDEPERDDADPDRIVQCPYDKNHQIRASRFPYHVLKCRKNHPKLASELKTCPFNARHLIPKHELSHHVANCEDKKPLTTEGHVEILDKFQVPLNSWTNPSPSEDWETETDDSASLFVWGKANNHQSSTQNKPEPMSAMSSRISSSDGVRAPRTLPWHLSLSGPNATSLLRTIPLSDSDYHRD